MTETSGRCLACKYDGEDTGGATPPENRSTESEHWPAWLRVAVTRHEALLNAFIRPDMPGLAFVSRAADPNFRHSMQSRSDPLPTREFGGNGQAGPFVDSVLGRFSRHLVVPAEDWVHRQPFTLRHRIIMDHIRFEAVTGFTPTEPATQEYFVTLDFRLVRGRHQRWDLSVVIWSELPFGLEHRPPLKDAPTWRLRRHDESLVTRELPYYRDLFETAARHTERWLEQSGFEHSQLNINGRRYMHPDFWIAVPATRLNPDDYVSDPDAAQVISTMLRVDSIFDDVISASVVNGDYLVVRRVIDSLDRRQRRWSRTVQPTRNPLYLVVVGSSPWWKPSPDFHVDEWSTPIGGAVAEEHACGEHRRCQRHEYVARQEFCARDLIDVLTVIETQSSFTLWDVSVDMQVWENHLAVYETTAAAGGRLWDSLATHLPIRRLRQLAKVHHAVELMHQTLLQGIADLNDLNMLSRECAERVDHAKEALGEGFDTVLIQRRIPTLINGDLRQAITQTATLGQLAATAERLAEHADRVAERYQDLIDAVKDAFDERRVREGDVLQKAGAILAFSLALDSIVSILSVTQPQAAGDQPTWLPVLAFSSGSIVVFTAIGFGVGILRLGRLGDRAFRVRYDGVPPRTVSARLGAFGGLLGLRNRQHNTRKDGLWRFMKNSSTDALEDHLRRHHTDPKFWNELDDQLTAALVSIWDHPQALARQLSLPDDEHTPTGRPDIVNEDIATLFARVGDWSIRALLFTERARRLYRYPLPKLTLLYRCISRMPGSYLRLEGLSAAPSNIVSEAELNRVIRRYARTQNASTRGTEYVDLGQTIDQRLQQLHLRSAAAAKTAINAEIHAIQPRSCA